jgi:hypothetical protein
VAGSAATPVEPLGNAAAEKSGPAKSAWPRKRHGRGETAPRCCFARW